MTQHFPRSTVSASFYCPQCARFTQHRIDSGRGNAGKKGPCLDCIERLNREHDARPKVEVSKQQNLFTEAT